MGRDFRLLPSFFVAWAWRYEGDGGRWASWTSSTKAFGSTMSGLVRVGDGGAGRGLLSSVCRRIVDLFAWEYIGVMHMQLQLRNLSLADAGHAERRNRKQDGFCSNASASKSKGNPVGGRMMGGAKPQSAPRCQRLPAPAARTSMPRPTHKTFLEKASRHE